MQIFKSFVDQALVIWRDSTGAARVGIVLLAAICMGAITGVGIWSSQPSYELVQGVELSDMPAAAAAFEKAKIEYKYEDDFLLVDKRKSAEARKALVEGGIINGQNDVELWSSLDTPDQIRQISKNNLESQIANSLMRMESIDDAKVTLSIPKDVRFSRKTHTPTAAVSLTISKVVEFDHMQAVAVADMVASSVLGMQPDNVVITDQYATNYETDGSFGHLSTQVRHRSSEEFQLMAKAQDLLFTSLGVGNAKVKISTVYEFPDSVIEEKEIDAENGVTVKEDSFSKTKKSNEPSALGVTGSNANNGSIAPPTSIGVTEDKEEKILIEKQFPQKTTTSKHNTPSLKTMTTSVIINSKDLPVDENNVVLPEVKAQYESMVKSAIGFDESRGDQFALNFVKFAESTTESAVVAAPIPWENIHQVLKNISLGFAGLIALLVGLMAFKKLTPVPTVTDPVPAGRASQIGQLSELVKQNPEVFSQIIAAWSNADPLVDEQDKSRKQPLQAA